MLRYTLAWCALLVAAMVNGAVRDGLYREPLGDLAAHQVSTLTGIILFALIIWRMTRMWPIASAAQAWTVGFVWLAMTLCFEFGFFHFVVGHPWSVLLHNYNILEGRVWVLILLWTFVAPYLFYRLQRRRP